MPKREDLMVERLKAIDGVNKLVADNTQALSPADTLLMAQNTVLSVIARELASLNDTLRRVRQ